MITVPREDHFFIQSAQIESLPDVVDIQFGGDAYFEITNLQAIDDNRVDTLPASGYRVMIRETGSNHGQWMNTPLVSDLIFGVAGNPRRLRTPIILTPNTVVQVNCTATQLTTTYNRFDIALWGVKRYQMSAKEYAVRRQRPYFVYATPVPQSVVTTTGFSQTIQIATDADFVVQNMVGVGIFNRISGGAGLIDWGAVRLQITDLSAGSKTFFQNPMGWFQVVGQHDVWMGSNRLLSPMVFRRNSQIRVDLTIDTSESSDVGTWRDIQIGFEGYKLKD